MRWETIVDLAREELGERDDTFFKDSKMRLAGARIQSEIASASRCVEDSLTIHTTPCVAVTTTNITLDGTTTSFDGVTFASGDNILVNGQTLSTSNGIYTYTSSGAWSRPTLLKSALRGMNPEYYVVISGGTVNANTKWKVSTIPEVVGLNPIKFTKHTKDLWSYDSPKGFIEIVDARADDMPLRQLPRDPNVYEYPSGQPTHIFCDGYALGVYPQPDSDMDIKFTYKRTTPTCAFSFWYDDLLSNTTATGCTVRVVDNNFIITVEKSTSTSSTVAFAFNLYATVGGLVNQINNVYRSTTPFEGIRAVLDPDIATSTSLYTLSDIYEPVNCYGRSNAQYIMVEPEVPNEAQNIIVHGIIDMMKLKDRESANSAYERSMYQILLDRFVKKYRLRDVSIELDGLNKRGGRGVYTDETIEIIIP